MNAEQLLAALGLAGCLALLLRMAIGRRRRARIDARLAHVMQTLTLRARALWRQRRLHGEAAREADALIRRARQERGRSADRDGNVVRPPSFTGGRDGGATDGRERKDH